MQHMVEVAAEGDLDVVDATLVGIARGGAEQLLDLLLVRVRQLAPAAVEELDAVVFRRVVRGGNDDAQVLAEERDRRSRQHAGEDGVPARRRDAGGEGALESRAGRSRVAADEDPAAAAAPERRRTTEPLDERRRQVLAVDTADAVGTEVPPRQG